MTFMSLVRTLRLPLKDFTKANALIVDTFSSLFKENNSLNNRGTLGMKTYCSTIFRHYTNLISICKIPQIFIFTRNSKILQSNIWFTLRLTGALRVAFLKFDLHFNNRIERQLSFSIHASKTLYKRF